MKEAVKLHFACLSSNNDRHPVPKTATPRHYTCRHFTSSHLIFTHLHYTTLSFDLNPFKFPTTSHHYTSPHSHHCSFRRFSPHFYSFQFIPLIISFLTLFLKILHLQVKVFNDSAGSWFQFLMVLFTKEYFLSLLPVLNFPNMIDPAQIVSPSQPVTSPFPRVRFTKCA